MTRLRFLLRHHGGASAAEFALVLPLLLLLLLGLIDAGRFMWEYNRAEKATHMGVRYAAVTDLAAGGLADFSFATDDSSPVVAGGSIPLDNFEEAECDSGACTCTGGDVCSDVALDTTAFANIVARMNAIYPAIGDDNVTVIYRNVGLGYAGNPYGSDVSPMITVELGSLQFQPITTLLFGGDIDMPNFKASLTAEDLEGTVSN